jgi:hypothetical protein
MSTKFEKGRCFFNSCHASLEHDLGDILRELGVQVVKANNACSHEERPSIPGYTDHDYSDDLRARVNTMACNDSDFDGTNFIFLMNTSDFQHRVPYFAKFRPVIIYLFGQHTDLQLAEFAGKVNNQQDKKVTPNIFTACYSKREYDYLKPRLYTELHHRLFHIRFAKRLEHYNPWKVPGIPLNGIPHKSNRLPFVFTASNTIHRRGDGCGWPQLKDLRTRLPHLLAGNDTQEVGGTGRIPFDDLRQLFWTCGAYVSFPAWPAPMVMNLYEAMLSGCPTAFYDNDRGAKEEGLFSDDVGCLSADVNRLHEYCQRAIKDKGFQIVQSKLCLERAIEFFEFHRQLPKWEELFSDLSKLW